jgi:hypothetical protein
MVIYGVIIVISVLAGWVCAKIAKHNGKNPSKWFVIGFIFNVIALLLTVLIERNRNGKS